MKGYRTIVFNLIMMIGAIVTALTGVETAEDVELLKGHAEALLVAIPVIWATGSFWIRSITDSPIFEKKAKR